MSLTLPFPAPRAEPGLAEQLLPLRRRWRVILACCLLVPGLTLAVLLKMPVAYTATGVLLYDPSSAKVPGDSTSSVLDGENQDSITASQSAVIASLPAAAAIAAQLNLAAVPELAPRAARFPFSLLHPQAPAPDHEALAEAVRNRLAVSVMPGSRVLTVSFTSTDPSLAAAVVNAAMGHYITHERDSAFASLNEAQTWLETHAATVQTQLDATETALAKQNAAAGVVQGAQASLTTETASRLAASLVEAQADLAMKQARLSVAPDGDAAADNAAIAPNLLPLRKEQADLTAQVQSMQAHYGPDYPPLQDAKTSLAAISGAIAAEMAREFSASQAEVAADKAQITTLQTALNNARAKSFTEDEESAPMRALEQRADAGRAMLRGIALQADQLAQDASLTRPDARILSAAAPPNTPSSPHRSMILAASMALGFCAGVLLAGLLEALDTSIRSGEVLRAATGLTCLGVVPEIADPQLAALDKPFSLYAEQLRALRTGLGLGEAPKIVAITAARPGEGKTTLTIGLARALAASGLRVLAVDGDIRQPSFDACFGIGGALGLTDYLAGLVPLEEVILSDELSALKVMAAGTQAKPALSLFLSPALGDCLGLLRAQFDVVLLDVPPAFALAEGRVLARLADCALLCVRWGDTPRRVVIGAAQLLAESGVQLAGAALTRVDARRHEKSGFADAEIYQPRYGGYFRQ
jgi:capsular exopolysaccharide synthesis family protein